MCGAFLRSAYCAESRRTWQNGNISSSFVGNLSTRMLVQLHFSPRIILWSIRVGLKSVDGADIFRHFFGTECDTRPQLKRKKSVKKKTFSTTLMGIQCLFYAFGMQTLSEHKRNIRQQTTTMRAAASAARKEQLQANNERHIIKCIYWQFIRKNWSNSRFQLVFGVIWCFVLWLCRRVLHYVRFLFVFADFLLGSQFFAFGVHWCTSSRIYLSRPCSHSLSRRRCFGHGIAITLLRSIQEMIWFTVCAVHGSLDRENIKCWFVVAWCRWFCIRFNWFAVFTSIEFVVVVLLLRKAISRLWDLSTALDAARTEPIWMEHERMWAAPVAATAHSEKKRFKVECLLGTSTRQPTLTGDMDTQCAQQPCGTQHCT